ncbi:Uncharacterised protein at_DN2101, partial [Pycnogonum litorale]
RYYIASTMKVYRWKLKILGIFFVVWTVMSVYLVFYVVNERYSEVENDEKLMHDIFFVMPSRNWIVLPPRKHDEIVDRIDVEGFLTNLTKIVDDWNIVVILDGNETLNRRNLINVHVIRYDELMDLEYSITKYVSTSVNFRRMIGYLFAIENGAQRIYDADETLIMTSFPKFNLDKNKRFLTPEAVGMYNIFQHFGQSDLWPRGFEQLEVEKNMNTEVRDYKLQWYRTPSIQHSLWQGHPDINQLLLESHKERTAEIFFDSRSPPIVIPKGAVAPYGAANTLYTKDVFWSLFLMPSRETDADIFRSIWAQKLLTDNQSVSFLLSSVTRGEQEYSEISKDLSGFLHFMVAWQCMMNDIVECKEMLIDNLLEFGYWQIIDKQMFDAWNEDLNRIGYKMKIKESRFTEDETSKYYISSKAFIYFPVEQPHHFKVRSRFKSEKEYLVQFQRSKCPKFPRNLLLNRQAKKSSFSDVILHIVFNRLVNMDEIFPILKLAYKHQYPSMIICGPKAGIDIARKHRLSYISSYSNHPYITAQNQMDCDVVVQEMDYNTVGVMRTHDDNILHSWHMIKWNKSKIWYTGAHHWLVASVDLLDKVVLRPDGSYQTKIDEWDNKKMKRPKSRYIFGKNRAKFGIGFRPADWFTIGTELRKLKKVFGKLKASRPGSILYRCHTNLMIRLHGSYRVDYAQADHFYVPKRLAKDFTDLLMLFLNENIFFEDAIPSVLRCIERPEFHQIIPFRHLYYKLILPTVENYNSHLKFSYVHPVKIGPLLKNATLTDTLLCDLILKEQLTRAV